MNDMIWFDWRGFFDVVEIRARVGNEWGIEFIIHTKRMGITSLIFMQNIRIMKSSLK